MIIKFTHKLISSEVYKIKYFLKIPYINGDFSIFIVIMKILNAVIAYKDFEWNDLAEKDLARFLVFTPNEIKTNIQNVCKFDEIEGYDNRCWGELSHHNFISNSIDFDWIVTNQYRRRFELPDYRNIYVANPKRFRMSIKEQFYIYHNGPDLDLLTNIIMDSKLEESFKLEWIKSLDDDKMICYNMFSGPKELYCNWIEICCMLLNKFKQIRNFNTYEDIVKYYDEINKKKTFTNAPYRIYAFLWERISNCYFRWYSKKHNDILNMNSPIYPCKIKLLEEGMKM